MKLLFIATSVAHFHSGKSGGVNDTIRNLTSELSTDHSITILVPQGSIVNVPATVIECKGSLSPPAQNYSEINYSDDSLVHHYINYLSNHVSNYDKVINFSFDLPLFSLFYQNLYHYVSMSSPSKQFNNEFKHYFNQHPFKYAFLSFSQFNTFNLDFSSPQVIFGGLSSCMYDFSNDPHNYMLWSGRISSEKKLNLAVHLSNQLQRPLYLCGFMEDESYYNRLSNSYDMSLISYLGYLKGDEYKNVLSKAYVFLHTATWIEAFGKVVLESLLSGTPVIAHNYGGPSEIIEHNVTGFLVDESDLSWKSAITSVDNISRHSCYKHAKANFSLDIFIRRLFNWIQAHNN